MLGNGTLQCLLPDMRDWVPVMIIFRALGYIADRLILQHILYDLKDTRMLEMLQGSITEAKEYKDSTMALDFLGRRRKEGHMLTKAKRIAEAEKMLRTRFLPHVSTEENAEKSKAYFLGYMVHRLLNTVLHRLP